MLGVREFSARMFWDRLPALAWLVVLAAVALLAAKWLTLYISPRPVAVLAGEKSLPVPVAMEDALALFGKADAPVAPRVDGLELTGVYAAGREGFATFNSSSGPISVIVGDEVRPGLVLAAVQGTRAILRGNGSEWQLELKLPPDLLSPRRDG